MDKNVRLKKYLDKESYEICIGFYKLFKANKDYFTLDEFIKYKSFVRKMTECQNEVFLNDGDKDPKEIWLSPKRFFDFVGQEYLRFIGIKYDKDGNDYINKEFLKYFFTHFFDKTSDGHEYGAYTYDKNKDFGKLF